MGDAKKCDRCGEFYKVEGIKEFAERRWRRMIKKGIELQIISPSLLLKELFANRGFSVCSVCKSRSLFLCHMICKYRQATFEELHQYEKTG